MMRLYSLLRSSLIFTLCTLLCLPISYAEEIVVIVNKHTTLESLEIRHIQRIFLRKERFTPQGDPWIPVNLNNQQAARKIFNAQLLQKSNFDLERYWNEQYFNGISPPYVLASEEAVLRFVSETPNAIGYILNCHLDNRVKPVYQFKVKQLAEGLCP